MQLARLKVITKGVFLAFGVAGLISCGSGDEASGGGSCGGVDESGVCLQLTLIEPVHLDDEVSSAVDVDAIGDCNGDGTFDDPEPFTEHAADVTFSALLVSGNPVAASFVKVDSMTVTFTQNTGDPAVTCTAPNLSNPAAPSAPPDCNVTPGLGPSISTLTTNVDVTIPVGTSTTERVSLMNGERLNLWTPAGGFFICGDGPYDPTAGPGICGAATPDPAFLSYTVRYLFSGEDEFGNDVDATGATEVTVGAYNNC